MQKPLLITYEYPPAHGGIGKYLEQEVLDFGSEVKIVRAQEYEMPLWPNWLPLIWQVLRELRKNQCNLIWVSHILPIGYIALVYKKLFKMPYHVYLHGLDLVRPRKSFWKSFWMRRILLNANEIIVNSNATSQLLNYYNIPASVARVKYPKAEKINPKHYEQAGKELRKKYNLENKKILLTIGRLVKRKGIDLVIRALPDVWKEVDDLVYVIIGDGEEREYLEQLKNTVILNEAKQSEESRGLSTRSFVRPGRTQDDLLFTGAISDKEKYAWLSACDCFILTPKDDADDFEGYGIVYKEAQEFGKRVIGSRVGGVPEAIGDNGVLIETNSINQIAQSIIKHAKS